MDRAKDQIGAKQPTPDTTFDFPDKKMVVDMPIDANCKDIVDCTNEEENIVDVFTTVVDLGTNVHEATRH